MYLKSLFKKVFQIKRAKENSTPAVSGAPGLAVSELSEEISSYRGFVLESACPKNLEILKCLSLDKHPENNAYWIHFHNWVKSGRCFFDFQEPVATKITNMVSTVYGVTLVALFLSVLFFLCGFPSFVFMMPILVGGAFLLLHFFITSASVFSIDSGLVFESDMGLMRGNSLGISKESRAIFTNLSEEDRVEFCFFLRDSLPLSPEKINKMRENLESLTERGFLVNNVFNGSNGLKWGLRRVHGTMLSSLLLSEDYQDLIQKSSEQEVEQNFDKIKSMIGLES